MQEVCKSHCLLLCTFSFLLLGVLMKIEQRIADQMSVVKELLPDLMSQVPPLASPLGGQGDLTHT